MRAARPARLDTWAIAILSFGSLCSCSCGENATYSVTTTLEDQGQRVGLEIEARAESGFVRSGMLTTRRYKLSFTYPGRPPSHFTVYLRGDRPLMTKEEMTAALPGLALRISPDRQHFALSLAPYDRQIRFFHLLPHGEPLHVGAFDEAFGAENLDRVDWPRLPAPESVLRDAVVAERSKASEISDFCMLEGVDSSESNLERVFRANLGVTAVADLVLESWPVCYESRAIVPEMVSGGSTPPGWLERLRAKVEAELARTDQPAAHVVGLVQACKATGDAELERRAYRVALARWPRDYEIHYYVFDMRVGSLPPDIRAELVARARPVLASGNAMQKEWAASILREADVSSGQGP